MKTASGMALIATGAILTFAVSAQPPGVNLHMAGFIIMATGLAGLLMPRRASGWLRRRIVRHGSRHGTGQGSAVNLPPARDPVQLHPDQRQLEQAYPDQLHLVQLPPDQACPDDAPDQDPLVLASQVLGQAELLDVAGMTQTGPGEAPASGHDQDADGPDTGGGSLVSLDEFSRDRRARPARG